MESLQLVLESRTRDLVDGLVRRTGLSPESAGRLVAAAGPGLLHIWSEERSRLDLDQLSTWGNVQRLLGGLDAGSIASELDMPPKTLWAALRTFVRQVLLMADPHAHHFAGAPAPGRGTRPHPSSRRLPTSQPGVTGLRRPRADVSIRPLVSAQRRAAPSSSTP